MIKFSEKKRTEFDLLYKSLIGKEIEILFSKNKNQIGLKGIIVYESANCLYLEIGGKTRRILKDGLKLRFEFEGKALNMDANLLFSTIINRIKKIK